MQELNILVSLSSTEPFALVLPMKRGRILM